MKHQQVLSLVGENPGGGMTLEPFDPERPIMSLSLTGAAGRTLCKLGGWNWLEYLAYTERRNLFYSPQPKWDAQAAKMAALEMMLLELPEGPPVLLLGAKVAAAFELEDRPLYTWFDECYIPGVTTKIARIPHPSGLNRVWNDPSERARAREFMKGLLD